MKIKDLIKDNKVIFDSFRQGNFYYNIEFNNETFQFTVPVEDIGTATMMKEDKAMYFMRWINKALKETTLVKV